MKLLSWGYNFLLAQWSPLISIPSTCIVQIVGATLNRSVHSQNLYHFTKQCIFLFYYCAVFFNRYWCSSSIIIGPLCARMLLIFQLISNLAFSLNSQIVNPNNKDIRDIPGLAPPAPSRRLLYLRSPIEQRGIRIGAMNEILFLLFLILKSFFLPKFIISWAVHIPFAGAFVSFLCPI